MADIVSHPTLTTSLVSYWKMDEASGTREDIHGTNDLTANGTGGVGSAAGKIGTYAADFEDTESDYLSITDASQSGLDFGGDISFSAWIKFETLPSSGNLMTIIGKGVNGGGNGAYAFQVYNNAGTYYIRVTVYDSVTPSENLTGNCGSFSPSTGTWYHLVWTFTESSFTSEGFVNGSSIGTYTHTGYDGTMNNSSGAFEIARNPVNSSQFFDGLIDEVGAWSKVLSGSEITDLSNVLPYQDTGATEYKLGNTSPSVSFVKNYKVVAY